MDELFGVIAEEAPRHCTVWVHEPSGLRALMVVDDVTLGPAAGGVRTLPYPSVRDALADASALARAMTLKCALGGVAAGGGKVVVLEHGGLQREAAFEELGARVNDLRGCFMAGSDIGTTTADLEAMARHTDFVHTDMRGACAAVARSVVRGMEACAEAKGRENLGGVHVAVQGCGGVGAAVAAQLVSAGAKVTVADVDAERAEKLAEELGASLLPAEEILLADVDIISPCAVGGVLTERRVRAMKAWAVCGGANRVLAERRVAETLRDSGILFVPDFISSAGGVIEGIAHDVMDISDPTELLKKHGDLTRDVLDEARTSGKTTVEIAERRAEAILAKARRTRS